MPIDLDHSMHVSTIITDRRLSESSHACSELLVQLSPAYVGESELHRNGIASVPAVGNPPNSDRTLVSDTRNIGRVWIFRYLALQPGATVAECEVGYRVTA